MASWSSLEYGGKWKLLHYAARRFFAPVVISAYQREDGFVEVWTVNDALRQSSATATIRIVDFGGKTHFTRKLRFRIPAAGSKMIGRFALSKIVPAPDKAFMTMELKADGQSTIANEHFFCAYKRCELQRAKIRTAITAVSNGYALRLSSDTPAFFVSLDARGCPGEFSDNCFTLMPGRSRVIRFTPRAPLPAAAFRKSVRIRHLRETYQ